MQPTKIEFRIWSIRLLKDKQGFINLKNEFEQNSVTTHTTNRSW